MHVKRGAVHAVAVMRHEMAFIDQNEMALAETLGRTKDALNAGKDDLLIPVAPAERRTIDAERCIRPKREQMLDVLLDQFLNMDKTENAHVGIFADRVAHQPRDQQDLPVAVARERSGLPLPSLAQ